MNVNLLKITIIALTCTSLTSGLAAEHAHPAHSKTNSANLTLDHGKKWATDLPLRQSMEKISQLMNSNMSIIHNNKMSDSEFKKLGQQIHAQTNNIFKNCKLSPKADQMLHEILIPILKAEKVYLGTEKSLSKHDATLSVMSSLESYGKYFNHKDWGSNRKK